jgi:nicotinamide-nucleotide amidase
MKAEILSIGAELLAGEITDTNASYLARQLTSLGVEVRRVTQVGDSQAEIATTLRSALASAGVVVCTGGIGPTPDDLTREAVAEVLDEEMRVDSELEATLRSWFARWGRPIPEANLKQASLIPSARTLPNRAGTAPGWWVEHGERVVILMPGVPVEMRTIWTEEARPRLSGRVDSHIVVRTLKTYGLGESAIAERLGALLVSEFPGVATYAKRDGVHVRIQAADSDAAAARAAVESVAGRIALELGDAVWGRDDEDLAASVTRLLEGAKQTLATREAASAGALASELARVGSGSYVGGAVGHYASPPATYTLCVGPAGSRSADGAAMTVCELELLMGDTSVARAKARGPSPEALPERAAIAALHLLRERLQSTD